MRAATRIEVERSEVERMASDLPAMSKRAANTCSLAAECVVRGSEVAGLKRARHSMYGE